jgi:CMP-N,N'-diacetyllegionaminic acid synthase
MPVSRSSDEAQAVLVKPPLVLATICARGGSKGVAGKNIRPLLGAPLIAYTIQAARACAAVGQIVVSTDSDGIAAIAEAQGVPVPFRRPADMASDTAAKILAIRHATVFVEEHFGFKPDIVIDLDVGAPLRTPEDIEGCVSLLAGQPDLDAAVTVYPADRNPYFNMVEFDTGRLRLVKSGPPLVARQAAPRVYAVSGSVFAWRRSSLMTVTHLFEGRWGGYVIPRERAIDIDDEVDFEFVEFLMARHRRHA